MGKWTAIVAALGFLFLVAAIIGWAGIITVDEGHESVVKKWGDSQTALEPGDWYWRNPATHSTITVDMRPQLIEMTRGNTGYTPVNVKTADQLHVPVDVAVTYNVTNAVAFHERWKNHENARNILIRNPARDVVYTVGGNMSTEEITSDEGRERMKEAIRQRLHERFDGEPVNLLTVELRDVRPPEQYMAERQRIKQEEQRVQQAEQRAQQRIEEARGEAESNRIVSESLDENLLTYRQIQAMENGTTVYVPVGGDGLPMYIDANNATAENDDGDQQGNQQGDQQGALAGPQVARGGA